MHPVLFLDFDGVLNHHQTRERFSFPEGGRFVGIDRANVERLNGICEAVPGARIVVSSTWRLHLDVDGLRDALRGSGFRYPDRVIASTPQWRTSGGDIVGCYAVRGDEIQAWVDAQPEPPSAIAILDDAEDMAHLVGRLVRTDMWAGGLTENDAQAVVALLRERAEEAA